MKYFKLYLDINQWSEIEAKPKYITYIHKENDDGTFQVYWPNKNRWSQPIKKIPDHIYDKFSEITEQEAFIEIL